MPLVARNSVYLTVSQLIARLAGLVVAIVIARHLGDAMFGHYTFILTVLGFGLMGVQFGLTRTLIRAIARDPSQSPHYAGAGNLIRFLAFLAGTPVVGLLIVLVDVPREIQLAIAIAYGTVALMAIATTWEDIFYAREQMGLISVIQVASRMLYVALVVLTIVLGLGLLWIIVGLLISETARTLALWVLARQTIGPTHSDWSMARRLGLESLPFLGITFFLLAATRVEVIVMGFLAPAESLGWYGAALNLVFAVFLVSNSVSQSLYPSFSRLAADNDTATLSRAFHAASRILFVISLPAAIALTLLAEEIVVLIYGDTFLPAAPLLAIAAWNIPLIFLTAPFNRILEAWHHELTELRIAALCTGLSVAGSIVLIHYHAHWGAALSNIGIRILLSAMLLVAVHRCVGRLRYPGAEFLRALPGLALFAGAIWYLRSSAPLIGVILASALYGAALLLFRVVSIRELRAIFRRQTG